MNLRWWLLAALGAGWIDVAAANVYRCDQGGRMQFSDKPCVAGQEPMPVAQLNTMETSAGDQALARQYDRDIELLHEARTTAAAAKSQRKARARKLPEAKRRKRDPHRNARSGGKVSSPTPTKDEKAAGVLRRPVKKEK
jgi:hypothetical protein